ncbi:hypothetical protein [Oceanobacillus iheyensis]|nr:hypothetical protein [Oceanobacillus iheyensis]
MKRIAQSNQSLVYLIQFTFYHGLLDMDEIISNTKIPINRKDNRDLH